MRYLNFNSFGFVVVASPGMRVRASATSFPCRLVRFQPRRSTTVVNVGNVYVYGVQSGGDPYAILAPEQVDGVSQYLQNVDLATVWIDADNANDAVLLGYNV